MKITSISTGTLYSSFGAKIGVVFGLGEDNKVYWWNVKIKDWQLLDK